MATGKEAIPEVIVKQLFNNDPFELTSRNPAVLSCGGIYIPHKGREERVLYHIINTSSEAEPVKVVTGMRPRNILYEVLIKESMN